MRAEEVGAGRGQGKRGKPHLQIIEMTTASLSDLMNEHPEHRAEAKQDLQLLNAQKLGEHEAEIEKIKNVFLTILRDVKKDMDSGGQPGEVATAAMLQTMRDTLAEQKQNPLTIDDVTKIVAGQIGQLAPMDEETADLFQQLAKRMIEQVEKIETSVVADSFVCYNEDGLF